MLLVVGVIGVVIGIVMVVQLKFLENTAAAAHLRARGAQDLTGATRDGIVMGGSSAMESCIGNCGGVLWCSWWGSIVSCW